MILAAFRANGVLTETGDLLASEYGLTSARWQVLGAVAMAGRPLTVPQIARQMGLTRQSVHTTVKRLVADGIVELAPNVEHRLSQIVRPTKLGQAKWEALDTKQASWVNELVAGMSLADLETTAHVLEEVTSRLESARAHSPESKGEDA